MAASALRRLRPLLLAVLAVVLLATAPGARAGRNWCMTDPIIKINGQRADIYLFSSPEMHTAATGPAKVVVTVPTGVATELIATDSGFGGRGYDVRFAESGGLKNTAGGLQVRVEVYVPATDGSLPVKVQFTPRSTSKLSAGSAVGTANAWVTLQTR